MWLHLMTQSRTYRKVGDVEENCLLSYATLLLKKRVPRTLEMSMHEYISNNTLRCRKDVLFGGFENYEHIDVNCKNSYFTS